MRILPVTFGHLIPQNQTNYRNRISQNTYITKPLAADTVSFGRSASNGELLRKIVKYKIPDLYTGQYVLGSGILESWMQNEVYSKSISAIVQKLKAYKDTLHPVEKQVFSMIQAHAQRKPNETLENTIRFLSPKARAKLAEIQSPIFNELIAESVLLPENQKIAFNKLIDTTIKQLNNTPIITKFSKTDFKYKLSRMAIAIKDRGIEDEIIAINKIINMTDLFPKEIKKSSIVRKMLHKSKNTTPKQQDTNETAIKKIEKYFKNSALKNDEELKNLIATVNSQINNIPTIINFGRKNFIHNLEEITNSLGNKKLAHKLIKIAKKLPTSHEKVAAFIMKESTSSSKKILYDMFIGSTESLDHLLAFSKGGKDTLSNYGITSQYTNSVKGNKSIETVLKESPEVYKNCQKYVDRLIKLHNNGTFAQIGLSKAYITDFAQTMFKLSPKEKPLVLDLSKLK